MRRSATILLLFLTCGIGVFSSAKPALDSLSVSIQRQIYSGYLDAARMRLTSVESSSNEFHSFLLVQANLADYLAQSTAANKAAFDASVARSKKALYGAQGDQTIIQHLLAELSFYSAIADLKSHDQIGAIQNIRDAFIRSTTLIKERPQFIPARKTYGVLQTALSALPSKYQKYLKYAGMQGSQQEGMQSLRMVVDAALDPKWACLQQEAQFELAALHLHVLGNGDSAWKWMESLTVDYRKNPIHCFGRVHVAEKVQKNEEVLRCLSQTNFSKTQLKIPFLSYLYGNALLHKLDLRAVPLFEAYIAGSQSSSHVLATYQRLKWAALLAKNLERVNMFDSLIKAGKDAGLEKDRIAKNDSYDTSQTSMVLLKSRLLYDGGYYAQAITLIRPFHAADFKSITEKTEYLYRKGQLYQATEQYEIALAFYKATISTGKDLPVYYASYAALQSAVIYEEVGQWVDAKRFYELATSFESNRQYRASIERKSRAGLARLEE